MEASRQDSSQSPIEASIDYLVECGWTREQARHLCAAIRSDKSPEHLWEIAPLWIEHCGESMRYVQSILSAVAAGMVSVTRDDDGQWLFALDAGKTLEKS